VKLFRQRPASALRMPEDDIQTSSQGEPPCFALARHTGRPTLRPFDKLRVGLIRQPHSPLFAPIRPYSRTKKIPLQTFVRSGANSCSERQPETGSSTGFRNYWLSKDNQYWFFFGYGGFSRMFWIWTFRYWTRLLYCYKGVKHTPRKETFSTNTLLRPTNVLYTAKTFLRDFEVFL